MPSKFTGILINDYCENIQLVTSKVLKKIALHAGSRDPSLGGQVWQVGRSFDNSFKSCPSAAPEATRITHVCY